VLALGRAHFCVTPQLLGMISIQPCCNAGQHAHPQMKQGLSPLFKPALHAALDA
jgi:hypothetical protein